MINVIIFALAVLVGYWLYGGFDKVVETFDLVGYWLYGGFDKNDEDGPPS